jgi:predicted transcriptional regulator
VDITHVHYITRLQYDASENKIQNMSSGKKLGENLRKWRLKKNMSQGNLATALSVDRAYISNIENGRMNPTLSTLEKIANALGISSSELLK